MSTSIDSLLQEPTQQFNQLPQVPQQDLRPVAQAPVNLGVSSPKEFFNHTEYDWSTILIGFVSILIVFLLFYFSSTKIRGTMLAEPNYPLSLVGVGAFSVVGTVIFVILEVIKKEVTKRT